MFIKMLNNKLIILPNLIIKNNKKLKIYKNSKKVIFLNLIINWNKKINK